MNCHTSEAGDKKARKWGIDVSICHVKLALATLQ